MLSSGLRGEEVANLTLEAMELTRVRFAIMPPARRIGFDKRIVVLGGQELQKPPGDKTIFGCGIISVQHF
jgi:hypothetical protein